ncbi:RNA binding protein [Cucurbitaria berberidis CBS 394.84]|uniref:Pre-mRNA-splicing factor CWC2 n=1 Tax=Cucurbitaria berberidis CBS 394.84 TaxID=1168544 RepID=A0A9P4GTM0_9PLEO|nr:RNA binding protein [Cucurbitaria berberidis CBS 394.84]KAF1851064.1 RNA binding protein [Cucurbitaria berberidis CBS 394.84]
MAEVQSPPAQTSLATPEASLDPSTSLEPSTSTELAPIISEQTIITTNAEGKKVKKIIRRKRRPARPQVDPATFKTEAPPATGTIFNIWYNKWSGGDREDKYLSKTAAQGRCNVAKDSGYTKADRTPGSYFCLFFARGICPKGVDCEYLHRLPTVTDIFPSNIDCFGRDKHSDYRDDMGGVGSFQRQNRTLYIGRIHPNDDIEEVVARHFQEWGQIERTRVLTARGVAFVTYLNEANSQFAKEAMAHQSLDNNEILNVRWATVDPNPAAAKREAARIEEQAAEAIRKALPAAYVAEIEGRDGGEAKKRRKIEGNFGLQGYEAPDDVWFAKEKSEWEAAREIEAGGITRRQMIEAGDAEEEYASGALVPAQQGGNGILSSSTLAALRGYTATPSNKRAAPVAGPLVGYGSDDDSD